MRREAIVLLTLVFALVLIGIFMVYSASAVDPHASARMVRQLAYVGIGLCALFFAAHFNYRRLSEPWLFRLVAAVTVLLLLLVLIPGIGDERKGAQRWIELMGFSFQPSELAKFAVVLLLAVKLTQNQASLHQFVRGFLPPLILAGFFAGLILLEKDLGAPAVIIAVAFTMLVMAGARWRFLIPSAIPVVLLAAALIVTSPHRVERIMSFANPWKYRDDEGYQLIQSMAGFAQGGVWGRGAGAGEQKLHYLPDAHTDFIFAVWAEEMGLAGTLTLVGLFAALLCMAAWIAYSADDLFGTLLAGGIVALVSIQAAINMAVTTGLAPTKGLPLPFISWGGSSLIVFMGLMGVVVSVALRAEPARRQSRAAA